MVTRALVQCGFEAFGRWPTRDGGCDAFGHVEVDRVGTDRFGSRVQAVEDQMRCPGQQGRVLAAEWLPLGTVADHDGFATGDRGDLLAGGEPRSAPSGQPGRLKRRRSAFSARRVRGGLPNRAVVIGQPGPADSARSRRGDAAACVIGWHGAGRFIVAPTVRVSAYSAKSARTRHAQCGGDDHRAAPRHRQKPGVGRRRFRCRVRAPARSAIAHRSTQ